MKEKELKFLGADVPAVEKRLAELEAELVFEGQIIADYYDTPDRALKDRETSIRLRTRGNIVELTGKVADTEESEARSYDETEVIVASHEQMAKLLELMGLVRHRRVRKHRKSYKLPDAKVEIDTIPEVPTYVEIEAERKRLIRAAALLLGFKPGDGKAWSTLDVLRHYGKASAV